MSVGGKLLARVHGRMPPQALAGRRPCSPGARPLPPNQRLLPASAARRGQGRAGRGGVRLQAGTDQAPRCRLAFLLCDPPTPGPHPAPAGARRAPWEDVERLDEAAHGGAHRRHLEQAHAVLDAALAAPHAPVDGGKDEGGGGLAGGAPNVGGTVAQHLTQAAPEQQGHLRAQAAGGAGGGRHHGAGSGGGRSAIAAAAAALARLSVHLAPRGGQLLQALAAGCLRLCAGVVYGNQVGQPLCMQAARAGQGRRSVCEV